MKLSKLPLLLLTSFSLLASVTLLSCSNSTGSGGGTKPRNNDDSENTTGNIVATAIDSGIKVTAKNLSGKSRIDIYKMIEDKDSNNGDPTQFFMTNFNEMDSISVIDEYVNVGEKYTYFLVLNGNWDESNTVEATAGKGELSIEVSVKDDGVELNLGSLKPSENYLEILRSDLADRYNCIESIDFRTSYTGSPYIDKFVATGKSYEYQVGICVEGNRSGDYPTVYAYTRPKKVTAKGGAGEIDLANTPVAEYNKSEKEITFSTLPEFTPAALNSDTNLFIKGLCFYIGGNAIGDWYAGQENNSFKVSNYGKIDGYGISLAYKSGENIVSYRYDQKNNPKLEKMPEITQ